MFLILVPFPLSQRHLSYPIDTPDLLVNNEFEIVFVELKILFVGALQLSPAPTPTRNPTPTLTLSPTPSPAPTPTPTPIWTATIPGQREPSSP